MSMAEARSCRPVSTGGLGVRVAVGVGVGVGVGKDRRKDRA